jgi:hypothetical protein
MNQKQTSYYLYPVETTLRRGFFATVRWNVGQFSVDQYNQIDASTQYDFLMDVP